MNKFFSILISVALVLMVSAIQPVWAGATTTMFKGTIAHADFVESDGECLVTSTFVYVAETTNRNEPGKPSGGPQIYLTRSIYDSCNNSFELNAFGSGVPDNVSLGKESASVDTTMWMQDYVTGTYRQIQLNVVWTGVGMSSAGISINRNTLLDGTRMMFRWIGMSQDAVASGVLSDDVSEHMLTSSLSAQIIQTNMGQVTITK